MRDQREPYISQTEHPRVAIPGQRCGDSTEFCTIVALAHPDHIELYPHGAARMGVRVDLKAAGKLGRWLVEQATGQSETPHS